MERCCTLSAAQKKRMVIQTLQPLSPPKNPRVRLWVFPGGRVTDLAAAPLKYHSFITCPHFSFNKLSWLSYLFMFTSQQLNRNANVKPIFYNCASYRTAIKSANDMLVKWSLSPLLTQSSSYEDNACVCAICVFACFINMGRWLVTVWAQLLRKQTLKAQISKIRQEDSLWIFSLAFPTAALFDH